MPTQYDQERKAWWTFFILVSTYVVTMGLGASYSVGLAVKNRMEPSRFKPSHTGCPDWDWSISGFWQFILRGDIRNRDGTLCMYGDQVGQAFGVRAQFVLGIVIATIAVLVIACLLARQVYTGDLMGSRDVAGAIGYIFVMAFVGAVIMVALAVYVIVMAAFVAVVALCLLMASSS